ncbi:type II secretion system F family protein [Nocardioides humilatus]|uniref:Type II secretion system F family protein n=2 Tax=Nocardioides humilatus TaxID=2607660 RepID=A0A5B1LIX7_9ACTN|nr:type II secretion system F family protein [Nocardioides humilatus]
MALGLPPPRQVHRPAIRTRSPARGEGLLRRWRPVWALLAGAGGAAFLGGPAAPAAGLGGAAVVWTIAGRIEPRAARLLREQAARDLPHVVMLLGAAMRAGLAAGAAVDLVCRALPGPAADLLGPVAARLSLGADPATVWSGLADDAALGPLGRTMARSHRSGAAVVAEVQRLSDELARSARAEVEDRARAVGVRAAVPLGVCLLPSFLLLGIVPLVAGLAHSVVW